MPPATLSAEPAGEEALKSAVASLPPPTAKAAQEANGQRTTGTGAKLGEAAAPAAAAAAAAVGPSSSTSIDEKPLDTGPLAEGGGGGGGDGAGKEGAPRAASAGASAGAETTAAPMSGGDVATINSSGLSPAGQELVGRQVNQREREGGGGREGRGGRVRRVQQSPLQIGRSLPFTTELVCTLVSSLVSEFRVLLFYFSSTQLSAGRATSTLHTPLLLLIFWSIINSDPVWPTLGACYCLCPGI